LAVHARPYQYTGVTITRSVAAIVASRSTSAFGASGP
jgi:hypothetical protein